MKDKQENKISFYKLKIIVTIRKKKRKNEKKDRTHKITIQIKKAITKNNNNNKKTEWITVEHTLKTIFVDVPEGGEGEAKPPFADLARVGHNTTEPMLLQRKKFVGEKTLRESQ